MRKTWSKDEILYAILEWEEEHGEPPKWNDWLKKGDRRPVSMTVRTRFGSWTNAIAEAGFTPRDQYSHPQPPRWKERSTTKWTTEKQQKASRWRQKGVSNLEIARRLGVGEATIRRHLGPSQWTPPKRKLKNRTREERVADLRVALEKGGQ